MGTLVARMSMRWRHSQSGEGGWNIVSHQGEAQRGPFNGREVSMQIAAPPASPWFVSLAMVAVSRAINSSLLFVRPLRLRLLNHWAPCAALYSGRGGFEVCMAT
jgi:hypothetical protein